MSTEDFPKSLNQSVYPTAGTKPLSGIDPRIYSQGTTLQLYSAFWSHYSQKLDPSYAKFMPSSPSPTYLSLPELHKRVDMETALNGWQVDDSDGSLKFTDEEVIKKQKGVLLKIFAQAIKSLMFSNLVGLSLPARIFDSITMLEYFAYGTRYAPHYISKAAAINDPLERLKLFVAGTVASLHCCLKSGVPLNPRLGETLQAGLEDGTQIFMEQTSHHPPITHVLYIGPNGSYVMYGKLKLEGKLSINSMSFFSESKLKVRFQDGQTLESTGFPTLHVSGLGLGSRTLTFEDSFQCADRARGLRAVVFFNYGESTGVFSSAKTVPKHCIEGLIYTPNNSEFNIYEKEKAHSVAELKNDVKTEHGRIKGSWLRSVSIDDAMYWDMEKVKPTRFLYANNPIPSDSRFREDLIWLRRGNVEYASAWKSALAIRQRQDKALSEKYGKNN